MRSEPIEYLKYANRLFDPPVGLIGAHFQTPGYHSNVPGGTWVHPTVHNFEYAALLLMTGKPADRQRAIDILWKVLGLQDQDPANTTYGIWSWLTEEPLSAMTPPDWNWADFCGARIGTIVTKLIDHCPADLAEALRSALRHAAHSIFRRNIRPDYTNIAVMGAGVCAVAGEQLGEPWLVDYAKRRLLGVVESTRLHGSFNEYNSPTYTIVVIHECERILTLIRDEDVRASARQIHHKAWEIIAEHFHPPTSQWAGPHGRAYRDRVDERLGAFLSDRTGLTIRAPAGSLDDRWAGNMDLTAEPLPCPAELVSLFQRPVEKPVEIVCRFVLDPKDDRRSLRGTTWFAPEACLGSISRESFWAQRRVVMAYWTVPGSSCAVLKLRFLHDGRDFSSMLVRNSQSRNRVLSAVNWVTDLADFHISMGRPADGIFLSTDLRLRYELEADDAAGKQIDDATFELSSGSCTARIHTAAGHFGDHAVRWELGGTAGHRWVDAICYNGPNLGMNPNHFGATRLAAGLELLVTGTTAAGGTVLWKPPGSVTSSVIWSDLSIEVPNSPETFHIKP